MENVPRDQHDIGPELDDLVDDPPQRIRYIRLALVDASGRLSLVLPEAEVDVREVNESHRARIALIHCVIFVRTCIGDRAASPIRDGGTIVDRTMMVLFESVIQPSRRSI
jgi:hypothetical protein